MDIVQLPEARREAWGIFPEEMVRQKACNGQIITL